jgi:hypothetical protein
MSHVSFSTAPGAASALGAETRLGAFGSERLPVHVQQQERAERDGEAQGEHVDDPGRHDAPEALALEVRVQSGEPFVEILDAERRVAPALVERERRVRGLGVEPRRRVEFARLGLVHVLQHGRERGVVVVVHPARPEQGRPEARHAQPPGASSNSRRPTKAPRREIPK